MALKRELGLWALSFYGLGLILGAGIYTILGAAAGVAGDAIWQSFLLASVAALLTGLSYAELSAMHPRAGAEYGYVRLAFPRAGLLPGVLGFVLVASRTAMAATVAVAFAGYLRLFLPAPAWLAAGALLLLCTAVNLLGVRESSRTNILFTIIETAGLLAIIAVGAMDSDFGAALAAAPNAGVLAGASLIFFAFLGFEDIATLAEESRDPGQNLPRAILIAVGSSTVLYILVALAAVALLPPERLARSASPLADAMRAGAPRLAGTLGAVALFATANTALVASLSASRLLFGVARHGDAPRSFTRLLAGRKTPGLALLAVLAGALALVPLGRVELLGSVSSLAALAAFVLVNVSLIVLRVQHPRMERPFRVPLAIGRVPLPAIAAALLAIVLAARLEPLAYVIFGGVALLGVIAVAIARRSRPQRTHS